MLRVALERTTERFWRDYVQFVPLHSRSGVSTAEDVTA